MDIGIAFGNEMRPGDTGWLTAYDPQLEPTAVVVGPKAVLILGGPEGEAYAKETKLVGDFRNVLEFKIPEEDYPGYSFTQLSDVLREACGGDPKRVGMLSLPSIFPHEIHDLIRKNTAAELVDASEILLDFKYQKSPLELEMMEIAGRISTYGMRAMLACIEPGMRETEVAACADYVQKATGADRLGINTIVCSGWRASNVIGRASNKVLIENEMVVLGCSARYDGLSSCIGRTVVVGKPSKDQAALIGHAREAFQTGISQIGPGLPANQVDRSVRNILSPLGLSPLYSLVHGIGWTEAMEGKGAATQYSTWKFPKGTAFMVDLGIFGRAFGALHANEVGLRIEDPYAIDHDGKVRVFTDLPIDCMPGYLV
jgi:Xaa-Pro aminopeptidase